MDSLVQAIKERIEEGTKGREEVNIGEVMEEFISEGYDEKRVKEAFFVVLKMHTGGDEYD